MLLINFALQLDILIDWKPVGAGASNSCNESENNAKTYREASITVKRDANHFDNNKQSGYCAYN